MTTNPSQFISEQIDLNTHIMWFEKSLKPISDNIKNLLEECNLDYDKINPEQSLSIADEYIHQSKFKFNRRVVKIEYSDERLKSLIDPKFNHLKCNVINIISYFLYVSVIKYDFGNQFN